MSQEAVTDDQLKILSPYVAGSVPDARGEMAMFCPLHSDTRKSANLNLNLGAWYCFAGCGGGSVRQLIDAVDSWVPVAGREKSLSVAALKAKATQLVVADPALLREELKTWQSKLQKEQAWRMLWELRGLNLNTLKRAGIGFDGRRFKIPIFSPERNLWNVRTYDPAPRPGCRKIWSVRGMGRARLYPVSIFDRLEEGDSIIFCEGEWDTLLALQQGYAAVTRTDGAGKPWHPEWDCAFAGLKVFVCHDADVAGEKGNEIVGNALSKVAEVFKCKLPYKIKPKHGLDLTDYLLEAGRYASTRLGELLANAEPVRA